MKLILLLLTISNGDHTITKIVDSRWGTLEACEAHIREAFNRYDKDPSLTSNNWMVSCVHAKHYPRPHR